MVRVFWLIGISIAFVLGVGAQVLCGAFGIGPVLFDLLVLGYAFTRFDCQAC